MTTNRIETVCIYSNQFFSLSIAGLVSEQESKVSKTRKPDAQRWMQFAPFIFCLLILLLVNLLLITFWHSFTIFMTAREKKVVTSSSHITTTVWLSDRHLSLLSRCYSGQRQSSWRMQSSTLCQYGRPPDALPTGRPCFHICGNWQSLKNLKIIQKPK